MRQREDALRQREETFRRRLNEELDTQVRQARREIDAVLAELKAKAAAIAREAGAAGHHGVTTGDTGAARGDARAAVDRVVTRLLEQGDALHDRGTQGPEPGTPAGNGRPPRIGDRVIVGGFGLEGVVTGLHDEAAEIDMRGKRMRASVRDLRVVEGQAPVTARIKVNVELQPRGTTPSDLNVIGCSVDEAIERAERFLDESLLTDLRTVRLIHGYGTGQLKRALTGFLQQHPLVARFGTAPPEQGGGGVTVVELKD